MSRPTFIDLFAGMGGFRLALERAGARCVFSSEIDPYACKTYEANFGEKPHGDVTKISTADVPDHDVLCGGFPCQAFSIAGKEHGFEDARGTLFFEIARILKDKAPRAFILENVKNLVNHDGGRTFEVIKATLEGLGYTLHFKVLSAQTLVPQKRERIFIVGFRDGLAFDFPELPTEPKAVRYILDPHVDPKYGLTDEGWDGIKRRKNGPGVPFKPGRFNFYMADLDGPTNTLTTRYPRDGSEILIPREGMNPRKLSPRECARLMGFPDDFKLPCSDRRTYVQLGNSVVVPLVETIAIRVIRSLVEGRREDHPFFA